MRSILFCTDGILSLWKLCYIAGNVVEMNTVLKRRQLMLSTLYLVISLLCCDRNFSTRKNQGLFGKGLTVNQKKKRNMIPDESRPSVPIYMSKQIHFRKNSDQCQALRWTKKYRPSHELIAFTQG